MGQALPFFGPPPDALDAGRAALDTPDVNFYSTDPGRASFRIILAERLRETLGTDATLDDLVITAGANHAFTLALTTLVGPGDEVILPSPYFTNHHMAVCALGATPIEAAVTDRERFAVTWADIAPHLSRRTKAIVLCTPSNPTGATISPADGAAIVQQAASRGLVVFSDETYMHFVYDGVHWSAASVEGWRENVVVIGTCSKSFGMMGWRVGFMLADATVCAEATKVQDAMIICAPVISQVVAERAVRDHWDYARGFDGDMRARRRMVADAFRSIPRLSWSPTAGGLFAFTRVDGCADSAALAHEILEQAHVVTIPGAAFGASGEGFLRLSYGAATSEDLAVALERVRQFFEVREVRS
jgi:aminotransferase